MGRLLNGLDKILDDNFFDELIRLDIDENDCSPTLNEFLGLQSENYDVLLNQIYIKDFKKEVNNNIHYNLVMVRLYSLILSLFFDKALIKSSENIDLSDDYIFDELHLNLDTKLLGV